MKTQIHVNRQVIAQNNKRGESQPVLTVKTYKTNAYAHRVKLLDLETGKELGEFVMASSENGVNPLSCGAKAWFQFDDKNVRAIFCDLQGNPITPEQAAQEPEVEQPEACVASKKMPEMKQWDLFDYIEDTTKPVAVAV